MIKTHVTKLNEVDHGWHVVNLEDKILGRVASEIAQLLMGKHKPNTSLNLDSGDYVVAVNADKIKVTGKKLAQKSYFRHSGYPGGEKRRSLTEQMNLDAKKVIETAVAGMLPKNKLRDQRLRRLKVFSGQEHTYGDKFKA